MSTYPVTCPTCFEEFEVSLPSPDETPCEVDYDCEVCCRPMLIPFAKSPFVKSEIFTCTVFLVV
jgi:hypothetical protein